MFRRFYLLGRWREMNDWRLFSGVHDRTSVLDWRGLSWGCSIARLVGEREADHTEDGQNVKGPHLKEVKVKSEAIEAARPLRLRGRCVFKLPKV